MKSTLVSRTLQSILISVVVLGLAGFGVDAMAATSTSDLSVTATVVGTCTIDASGGLAFGNFTTAAGAASTGILTVTCTDGTTATVTLGQGANDTAGTAAAPQRQMASGANLVRYDLYQDPGNSVVWGNTPLTGESQTFTGVGGTDLVVHGVIPAGQTLSVGSYSDTVVATVTF
jgi:VCBS repeat-containing protein